MIHVIATIRMQPGSQKEFLKAFRELVPKVHAEAGVIEYGAATDLSTSIPGQSRIRGDVVTVIEKWESVAALEAHLASPHMVAHRESVKDIVTDVEIQVLEPV